MFCFISLIVKMKKNRIAVIFNLNLKIAPHFKMRF